MKMSILPQWMCRFNASPTKIPAKSFKDIDRIIALFIWKGERIRTAKMILKMKSIVGNHS